MVARTFAPDVVVGRDRREYRDFHGFGKRGGLAGAVVLVDHDAGDADIAAELLEVVDGGTDVVGDVERLEIVRPDDDDLLAHVACNRQAEAAADDIAEEIQQDEVEAPLVEAELFQQLKAVDDSSAAAAASDFRSAQLHREHAVALEADIADRDFLAGRLFGKKSR